MPRNSYRYFFADYANGGIYDCIFCRKYVLAVADLSNNSQKSPDDSRYFASIPLTVITHSLFRFLAGSPLLTFNQVIKKQENANPIDLSSE